MRPAGIGRLRVRSIRASISASNHMLMAPDAPAPSAIVETAISAESGSMDPGATNMPTRPVKTTSDMTRGFRTMA